MAKLAAGAAVALVAVLVACVARTCDASYGFPYPIPHSPSTPAPSPYAPGLSVGHYELTTTCRNAEDIVSKVVTKAVLADPGIGAGLIRLFFHDCFVQGCDASVLLEKTPANQPTERVGAPNINSLRGFEVINDAKAALEAINECRGVVSCADIVAFAGRDATVLLGSYFMKNFKMPSGRYDGRVSLASETIPNLPPPFANLQTLTAMFAAKGFTPEEMVTLSGAHSIGISHCSSFADNLPPNSNDIEPAFASSLKAQCGSPSNTVNLDSRSPNRLDNLYYWNVKTNQSLFKSDAALLTSEETKREVDFNAFFFGRWEKNFIQAMVKMGNIDVKTKANGEIRSDCRFVN